MFTGYRPETADFLWGIRMNNHREWFLAHKNEYIQYLYEPTKALGQELFQPFLDKPGNLCKVSRIYRDARLHHSLPYKESLWICIRKDVQWWGENCCLYFEINPDGVDYGFFFWKPKAEFMKRFRRTIAAQSTPFLEMIRQVERSTGKPITAGEYARPEKWENPALERFYRWKDRIACDVHEDFSEDVFSAELSQRVGSFFEKLTPLYDYFNTI